MASRYGLWVVMLLAASGPLLASEAAAESEAEGNVNLFSGGELGMSIFTLLIFFALLFILRKWAWKPLLDGLRRRENHIRQSIEETELAREEAFLSLQQYEARMARAQEEAQKIVEAAQKQALEAAEALKVKAEAEVVSIRQRVEQEMQMLREQALRLLSEEAAELTTGLAGQIVRRQLNPDDHRSLIQESLSKLGEAAHKN